MAGARPPFLLLSAALHLALFALTLLAWPFVARAPPAMEATPVTLVAEGPADLRPAVRAAKPAQAAAPEPQETPAPPPQPAPPPAPAPTPKPAPPPQPAQTPQPAPKPAPQPRPPTLDLGALAAAAPKSHARTGALDLSALAAADQKPARPRAPVRGAVRPDADRVARTAVGRADGAAKDARNALQAKLNRLWNPNCEVEGGGGVIVRVHFQLSPDGRLLGPPTNDPPSGPGVSEAVMIAAVRRALSAVRQGEPYSDYPRNADHAVTATFDARAACQR